MPAKKKILSIKDKVKAQWKLEQAALKKADVGTTKSKVPLKAKTQYQAVEAISDEKKLRKFLESQLNSTDDEMDVEISHFVTGSDVPYTRKAFFNDIENVPGSMKKKLFAGYLAQTDKTPTNYVKDWLHSAKEHQLYYSKEGIRVEKKNLSTKMTPGSDDYGKYLAMMEEVDKDIDSDLTEMSKYKARKLREQKKMFNTDDEGEKQAKGVQGDLVDVAVSEMLAANKISDPNKIPVRYVDKNGKEVGRGFTKIPQRWIDEEANKAYHGRTQADYSIDQYNEHSPWSSKRLDKIKTKDQVHEDIWNLNAQIQAAWIKLENIDEWTASGHRSDDGRKLYEKLVELYTLRDQLRNKRSGEARNLSILSMEERKAKIREVQESIEDVQNQLRELGKIGQAYQLHAEIVDMQKDLLQMERNAPGSLAKRERVLSCSRVYENAPWLKAKVKQVYISGDDPLIPYFSHVWDIGNKSTLSANLYPVDREGRVWYAVSKSFFRLLCTSKGKVQEDEILTLPIPIDLIDDRGIPGGPNLKLNVMVAYDTNRRFYIQDESVYADEIAFFKTQRQDIQSKIQSIKSEPLSLQVKELGRSVLSTALSSTIIKNNTAYVSSIDQSKINIYEENGPYVSDVINTISYEDDEVVDVDTFVRRLGDIIIYLGPNGSKVFEKRVAHRYYDPVVLATLPQSEKYPEIFDNPLEDSNKIVNTYRDEFISRLDIFTNNFLEILYSIKTGEPIIFPTVDVQSRLSICDNYDYLLKTYGKRKDIPNTVAAYQYKLSNTHPRDIIHYMEDGSVYCFIIPDLIRDFRKADQETEKENVKRQSEGKSPILTHYINPVTKEPMSSEFIDRFKKIYINDAYNINNLTVDERNRLQKQTSKTAEKQLEVILAPGLIDKIRYGILKIKSQEPASDTASESDSDSNSNSDSDSDNDGVVSRTRGGSGGSKESNKKSNKESNSDSDDEGNYDGICRHCKGEIPKDGKGIRTLYKRKGSDKSATGSEAFHKREFCCRYCAEDCNEFDK